MLPFVSSFQFHLCTFHHICTILLLISVNVEVSVVNIRQMKQDERMSLQPFFNLIFDHTAVKSYL